jgi:protoporphyrinogen oxidase
MSLALRLSDAGFLVTILEEAGVTGGLAAPAGIGGYTWDRFYHVILLSDLHLRSLIDDLGLSDRLHWGTTRTGFYTDGQLHSLSDNLEFLTFKPLSLLDKVRLGATIFYASRVRNWRHLETVSVDRWLVRLSGRRVFDRIWLPLLKSKLGDNYRQASAAFIWAIIARMYAARRSGMKREMFGYVDGGYDAILQRFQAVLDERGISTSTGRAVSTVSDDGSGVEVRFGDGSARRFDRVVLTIPCSRIAAACPGLSDAEKARLRGVVYQGIVCASLLLCKPLGGFYVTNITDSWVPFTGVIEMTALVDAARFGGSSLVYLPRYLTQDDPFWEKPDEEIRREFVAAIVRMYPHVREDDVLAFQISRAREVLAVSTLRYSIDALPPVRTSLPHVFVVNSAQILAGTLNVNETLAVARTGGEELIRSWREEPGGPTPAGRPLRDGVEGNTAVPGSLRQ